jgi:hypothetical protein
MQYYVVDTTLNPPQDRRFNSYGEIVNYLSQMSQRAYGQDRKARMIMLEEIGHGQDDSNAVNFVRSMSEKFNVGVLRDGLNKNEKMRCDITSVALFQQEEFGN